MFYGLQPQQKLVEPPLTASLMPAPSLKQHTQHLLLTLLGSDTELRQQRERG